MPVVIEELTTSLEIQDEAKIRKLVQEEITRALAEERRRGGRAFDVDPADPAAGGEPEM
jgi:predicted secreted Zn-dependent protease